MAALPHDEMASAGRSERDDQGVKPSDSEPTRCNRIPKRWRAL
jgi:hypothetical protein